MQINELTIERRQININDLTVGQAKELAQMFAVSAPANTDTISRHLIGKKCIVRTYSAGVWYGEISEKSGNEVILRSARRLWRWWSAKSISLSGVALYGIIDENSRIPPPVESVWLESIELIPATILAQESIERAAYAEAE